MNKHAVLLGSLGGKARASKMTKEERSEHARTMVNARKDRKKHEGKLEEKDSK